MTDVTTINGKKYIKITQLGGTCDGCALHVSYGNLCLHPSLEPGCIHPSVVYKEFVKPEEFVPLTKAEVIAAIYSQTSIECCIADGSPTVYTPDFLSHPTNDLDKKVIIYLQNFQNNFEWRYKKVPKVLSVTTRKFLMCDFAGELVINIWSTHWATPQSEVPSLFKSFIRWLEEPQTTTHEIEEI